MKEDKISIGGQAVIEGVMMRSPEYVSTVIRRADGTLEDRTNKFIPLSKKYKILNTPVIRGAISLFEMMKVGIGTLNWSADKAIEDENIAKGKEVDKDKKKSFFQKLFDAVGTSLILVIALGIFMYIPYKLTSYMKAIDGNQFLFNLFAGLIRTTFLILYMYAISFMKDVKRLFAYHGAEHKTIALYEKKLDLTVENAKKESRFHPRCGTSFILIAAIITIFIFSIFDTIIVYQFGEYQSIISRVGVHLLFVPFAVGVSFEILKLSDKYSNIPLVKLMIMPGLWLQHITTNEPDESQLEVALKSVKLSTAYLEESEKTIDNG
ncbi:MAG: DUF1385 domain-containing protein [Candidatus Delongbacteria bacterium]|nr:DUF1385 domain-containing protein [Candidatus Delongbacteria bacterium]